MTEPIITITPAAGNWVVRAGGAVFGQSSKAVIVQEGNYPEVVYFDRSDIAMDFFDASPRKTTCPYKGQASYLSIAGESSVIENAAWSYEDPKEGVERIKGMLAFDLNKVAVEQV